MSEKGIVPCVGCDETVDALYCSYECMMEDDNTVCESPITGDLYYVTEWENAEGSKIIAHEKQPINWPKDEENT